MAWACEIPPAILWLSYSSNYSASQGEINEFKIFLNPTRTFFGEQFPQLIYEDWFISSVLTGRVEAPGFLEFWRDPLQHDKYAAWVSSDWSGAIKPSSDIVKVAKGYTLLVKEGFITRARSTRETTGMKYSKVVKRLKQENEQLAEALRPILELKKEFGNQNTETAIEGTLRSATSADTEAVLETVETMEDNVISAVEGMK
jgi:capsid protein